MELHKQEDAAAFKKSAYLRDDHVILEPESISLFGQGISLILSRWVPLQLTVADPLSRCTGVAECLRLTCGKVKHEAVEKMAADILAFFMKPEEHCIVCTRKETKEPCTVEQWRSQDF